MARLFYLILAQYEKARLLIYNRCAVMRGIAGNGPPLSNH